MSNVMKAVQINEFGGRNVLMLNDIAIPTPAENEILIKVKSASVNPVDWKIREGYLQPLLNQPQIGLTNHYNRVEFSRCYIKLWLTLFELISH